MFDRCTRGRHARTLFARLLPVAVLSASFVTAAAGPASAAVPTGPFTVDVNDREAVRQFYLGTHQGAVGVANGWTGGSTGSCTPGSVSTDFLAATLSRTNYFRTMAGVPNVTYDGSGAGTSSSPHNASAQATALMQAANNRLAHEWTAADACFTQLPLGVTGSGLANLAAGGSAGDITSRVDALMYDGGELGHRRNMLAPRITEMGAGAAIGNTGTAFFAHKVLTTPLPTRPAVRDNFVAWPNKGFVPYQVVPARWSFSLEGADFSQATVSMTRNGTPVAVQALCFDPSPGCGLYGEQNIIWRPTIVADGAAWPKPSADDPFQVTITGVKIANVTQAPYVYTTTIIDPSQWDKQWTAPTGSATPPVGQNSTYSFTNIPGATGYQWRTTQLTNSTFSDGAEGDLSNWTAAVGAYAPIQTAIKATGNAAFHLSIRSFDLAGETLTLNRTLMANANSQLTFKSRVTNFDNLVARVEVSADGGTTWDTPPAFEQAGGNEAGFTDKTVSLGAYAGKQIRVRFWVRYNFSGNGVCVCDSSSWYFDDVALVNLQEAGAPVLSGVLASPSFPFNPPAASQFLIDLRPQFAGPTFGAYSQTLTVNASGAATPPAAPTAMVLATQGANVNVSWTDNAANETGFHVQRARWVAGTWTEFQLLPGVGANVTSTVDSNVTPGFYAYLVRSTNASGDSDWLINVIQHSTATVVPPAPTNLVPTNSGTNVNLAWADNASDEYVQEVGRARFNPTTQTWGEWVFFLADRNATSYVDANVPDGQYAYLVRSDNKIGASPWVISVIIHVNTAGVPAAPTNLVGTPGAGSASLTWTDVATNEVVYEVQRAQFVTGNWTNWTTFVLDKNSTTFTNTGVAAGQYAYLVRSTNPTGSSAWVTAVVNV